MINFPSLFPDSRRGAVSLTYDDALAAHLDHVIPDLEAAGLRGTFYIPTGAGVEGSTWHTRQPEWKAAAARGHELGNHTQHHPCSLAHAWVKPNRSLEAYDLSRMEMELVAAARDVRAALGDEHYRHSYAYTCGEDFVGPDHVSYRPIVKRLFPAARHAGLKVLANPMEVESDHIPAWAVMNNTNLGQLVDFVDKAIEQRKWAVFVFHGVGGGHAINISRESHRALCKHIVSRTDDLYCGTFLDVASAILK